MDCFDMMDWRGRFIAAPPHEDADEVWWRAELSCVGGWWRLAPEYEVEITPYPVVRRTPKGVWLTVDDGERFVLGNARRQFAVPTISLAVEGLRHRLQWRVSRLTSELREVTAAASAMETFEESQLWTPN